MKQKGFTLVELLVVVAIIAILSVIGLTIFTSAQFNARDARRKSDVDAIANALETNKPVASIYYKSPTDGSWFSGSTVPTDTNTSVTQSYCIKVYSTDTGAQETNPNNTWAGTGASAGCPPTWLPATIAGGFAAANFPADTEKSWKVCARLENTSATPNVYCKPSSQ